MKLEKFNKRKLKFQFKKSLLLLFSLALIFSPFSSLGELAYAEGDSANQTDGNQDLDQNTSAKTNDSDAKESDNKKTKDGESTKDSESDGNKGATSDPGDGDEVKKSNDDSKLDGNNETPAEDDASDADTETITEEEENTARTLASPQANNPTADGFVWIENSDGTVMITGYEGNDTDLTIPSEIDGKKVTRIDGNFSISDGVFAGKELTSVTLPDTLKTIGRAAFYNNLITKIEIPNSVESIGANAFRDNKLTKVTLPTTLSRLSMYVFRDNLIETIELPDSLTYIDSNAFENNQLTKIDIPKLVETIEEAAFMKNNITEVTFPEGLNKIGNSAFTSNQLKEIHLPESLNEITGSTFSNNPSLETITVDSQNKTFKDINEKGLYTRDGKKIIRGTISGEIDENTEIIGENAFSSLKITSLTIPNKVRIIERGAFIFGDITGTLTIPHNVTKVDQNAFYSNTRLSEVKILNPFVELIGKDTFLTEHNGDPQKVTIYGYENSTAKDYANEHNYKFEMLTLDKNVTAVKAIEQEEVPYGEKLENIHLPNELEVTIEDNGQSSTETVTIDWDLDSYNRFKSGKQTIKGTLQLSNNIGNPNNLLAEMTVVVGDSDYKVEETEYGLMITDYTGTDTELKIPEQFGDDPVTIIGEGVFAKKSLKSVEIPSTVEYIGPFAFTENNLEEVHLQEGLKEIYGFSFAGNLLTSVKIPSTVEFIEEGVFAMNPLKQVEVNINNQDYKDINHRGLYTKDGEVLIQGTQSGEIADGTLIIADKAFQAVGLKGEVKIPNSVQYIGEVAFSDGEIREKINHISKVEIPGSVEEIGEGAFFNVGLEELIMHEGLERIGSEAFSSNSLEHVEIPGSVKLIDTVAFDGNSIQELILHEGLERIEENAFTDNLLTSLEIPSTVVFIGELAFQGNQLEHVLLHEGLKEIDYEAFTDNLLTRVDIPSSVEKIWSGAFSNNNLEQAIIRAENIDINSSSLDQNQDNPANLTIYGYRNSDVETFANNKGYTFKPFSQLELDSKIPHEFNSEDLIEIVNGDGEIVGTIQMPNFDGTDLLASARLLIRDVDEGDLTATGFEVAGQIVDILFVSPNYDPDNPNEDEILNNEIEGEFGLTLRVNDDASIDAAMYHEIGTDDWEKVGENVVNGFVTATVTSFSKYGVLTQKTPTTDITVKKEWIGEKQNSVTVKLLANDKEVNQVELSNSNNWEHPFTDLPLADNDGRKIEYTVEEVEIEGYETKISGTPEDGFVITNTEVIDQAPLEPANTTIDVEKVWEGKSTDSVTINLLADGNIVDSVQLDESDEWKHTFTDLPVVDDIKDEDPIEYTVEEIEIEGYEVSIDGNAKEGFIITNTEIESPVDPEDPTDPTDPEDPKDPEEPTDPEDPVDPTDPTDPEEPVDPSEPTDPTDPEVPEIDPCESQDPIATGCPEDQLKEDDEGGTDDEDQDGTTITVEDEDGKTTSKKGALPSTATNTYNLLILGGLLLIAGLGSVLFYRRKNKASKE